MSMDSWAAKMILGTLALLLVMNGVTICYCVISGTPVADWSAVREMSTGIIGLFAGLMINGRTGSRSADKRQPDV